MDPFRKKMLLLLVGHGDPEAAVDDDTEDQGDDQQDQSNDLGAKPTSLKAPKQDPRYTLRNKKKGGY